MSLAVEGNDTACCTLELALTKVEALPPALHEVEVEAEVGWADDVDAAAEATAFTVV